MVGFQFHQVDVTIPEGNGWACCGVKGAGRLTCWETPLLLGRHQFFWFDFDVLGSDTNAKLRHLVRVNDHDIYYIYTHI